MKKIFLAVIAMLSFCGYANAQQDSGTEVSIGVGYSGSYVVDFNNGDAQQIGGFNAGISADHYFNDQWSLKVNASYQQKGWADGYYTDNAGNEVDGVNFKLNYITVPVMANWHFGRDRNWYLDCGPYIGFLLSASESSHLLTNTKSLFNSTDAGIALGIGLKIPINDQMHFFIEYSGQAAVTNLNASSSDRLQNATGSLNIGLGF
ncbi:porin family protein [Mucilaginibacter sp. dw_454]|uniref:porin family protein n=1 Tax=Mucilaginibacter sp. dw_454 TaxID=2720079 RepID=UPI001BD5BBE9|nr:porin family protein [Mucilaginibacter sp. dw_454]